MTAIALLTRETLPPLEVHQTSPTSWRTPESYVNCRKIGALPGDVAMRLADLLEPELAERLGVPVECVILRSSCSWVDPRGRLVFWLEAWKPSPKTIEGSATLDI